MAYAPARSANVALHTGMHEGSWTTQGKDWGGLHPLDARDTDRDDAKRVDAGR